MRITVTAKQKDMDIANNKGIRIAIASGKGGTGKTMLTTNMFYALLQNNINAILTDCDAEQPNSNIFFKAKEINSISVELELPVIDASKCDFCGLCYEYCNYNAIFYVEHSEIIKVLPDLCHSCRACLYACKYGAISEIKRCVGHVRILETNEKNLILEAVTKPGTISPVPVIKKAVRESFKYKTVIYDSPPGTACPFIHSVIQADYIILVTEPTPFGLSDLKQAVDTLRTMDKNYGVIINRCDIAKSEIKDYLNKQNIPVLLEIEYDEDIAYKYSQGILAAKDNPVLQKKLLNVFQKLLERYGNCNY